MGRKETTILDSDNFTDLPVDEQVKADEINLDFLFENQNSEMDLEFFQYQALQTHLPRILSLLTPAATHEFKYADEATQHSILVKMEEILDLLYTFTIQEAQDYFQYVAEEFQKRVQMYENPQRLVFDDPYKFPIDRGRGRFIWSSKLKNTARR